MRAFAKAGAVPLATEDPPLLAEGGFFPCGLTRSSSTSTSARRVPAAEDWTRKAAPFARILRNARAATHAAVGVVLGDTERDRVGLDAREMRSSCGADTTS